MITHYDLFAGIGGFSLALEEVFENETIKHIFCEWEQFPTSVLRRHWPDGQFWGDIAELVADTQHTGLERSQQNKAEGHNGQLDRERGDQTQDWSIVTGGFPCQPFSHAGRRKGTADDRYQWPNMFAVIRNTKPEWVIAENVRGLVTWNDGLVLEQVCADLESQGYEVQPFIIPAVAVNAPHRRDRVWIIAKRTQDTTNATDTEHDGSVRAEEAGEHSSPQPEVTARTLVPEHEPAGTGSIRQAESGRLAVTANADRQRERTERGEVQKADGEVPERHEDAKPGDADRRADANARPQRRSKGSGESLRPSRQESERTNRQYPDWQRNWQEVAFATCDDAVDDGLSRLVDGVSYSRAKWRKDSLKAYGNGIVPQVAINIMQAIKASL